MKTFFDKNYFIGFGNFRILGTKVLIEVSIYSLSFTIATTYKRRYGK